MKYYFINKHFKNDILLIGQSSFNSFLWQQGLLLVIDTLKNNNQLLNKYDIIDQNNKIYQLEQFLNLIKQFINKN